VRCSSNFVLLAHSFFLWRRHQLGQFPPGSRPPRSSRLAALVNAPTLLLADIAAVFFRTPSAALFLVRNQCCVGSDFSTTHGQNVRRYAAQTLAPRLLWLLHFPIEQYCLLFTRYRHFPLLSLSSATNVSSFLDSSRTPPTPTLRDRGRA